MDLFNKSVVEDQFNLIMIKERMFYVRKKSGKWFKMILNRIRSHLKDSQSRLEMLVLLTKFFAIRFSIPLDQILELGIVVRKVGSRS